MKRHLMAMVALTAAVAAYGVDYDPKVHGNPIVVTDGTVEINGNGAVIDGKGVARCATLGPKVTLKNFTLRNGSADWGGGAQGGKLVNCTIENCEADFGGAAYGATLSSCTIKGCTARESGAALGDSTATSCTISGCSRAKSATNSRLPVIGGIVYGSTLTSCKLMNNSVPTTDGAPIFGGIGEGVTMSGGQATDNTIGCAPNYHYGVLFANSKLTKKVTVKGNSVAADHPNAYYETDVASNVSGDTGDAGGSEDDKPITPDKPVADPNGFAGGATYVGWLQDANGAVAGTVTIKAGKANSKGTSRVSVAVEPLEGKKKRTTVTIPVGQVVTDASTGLTLEREATSGALTIGSVSYGMVQAFDNSNKSSIKSGTWTFTLDDGGAAPLPFVVSVTAKTGKAKMTAYLEDGTKLSTSSQGVKTSDGTLYLPFAYTKKSARVSFVLVAREGKATTVSGLPRGVTVGEPPRQLMAGLRDGAYAFQLDALPGGYLYQTADGFALTPDGETVTVSGKKLKTATSAGAANVKDGRVVAKTRLLGKVENLSKLKLSYAPKTGLVTGSYRLYWLKSGKLKYDTVKVYAVKCGDNVVQGLGVVKKKGAMPIALGLR